MPRFREYYILMKPGIIRGNLITVTGGFFLASQGSISLSKLVGALVGSALIVGSGCVFNNYIDRNIDKKMKRTSKRALVTGSISNKAALLFGTTTGLMGVATLALLTNWLTVLVGITGFIFYVVVYSIWKRKGPVGTLVGSISGSVPPVAGYTAVTGSIDGAAAILFLILTVWQMPHFYAIALFRSKDYALASIPVLPNVHGVQRTKRTIIYYIFAFIGSTILLTSFGYTGYVYLAGVLLAGVAWLVVSMRGFNTLNTDKWAHGVFGVSLLTLTVFSVLISLDHWLI